MSRLLVALPDMQVPFHDRRSLKAVEEYMKTEKIDVYVNMGDFLDYFCISRFNKDKPGLVEGQTILAEVEEGEKILQRHVDIVRGNNPKAKMYLLEGNHEYRATDFADRNPQLKGLIEPEIVLKLKEKNVKYIRSWSVGQVLQVGKAFFIHGNYTNQHHAKKHVEAYEENIFYGHTHDCNSYNKTSKATGKTKVGQSLGCLCHYPKKYDYKKGWPDNWSQAFMVMYLRGNGTFNYNLVRITDHTFTINGKTFKG